MQIQLASCYVRGYMEIIGKWQKLENTKGLKNMSSNSKTQGSSNISTNIEKYTQSLFTLETSELEVLLDLYGYMPIGVYKDEIEAIRGELAFRNSPLGAELL